MKSFFRNLRRVIVLSDQNVKWFKQVYASVALTEDDIANFKLVGDEDES